MVGSCSVFETDPLLRPAPPLTLENVFEAVKRTRNWRGLGDRLGIISELDDIERQHSSVEARLKAVVELFLLDEGYQPTWRRVIHVLHRADEIPVAHDIITYGEAVGGEWTSYVRVFPPSE